MGRLPSADRDNSMAPCKLERPSRARSAEIRTNARISLKAVVQAFLATDRARPTPAGRAGQGLMAAFRVDRASIL